MAKSIPKDETSWTSFWSSILSFANLYQFIDTQWLASCYLIIYYSNGFAPLIKVVGQAELGKLCFWPMTQISLEMAQIGVPHWPYRHPPGVRVYASRGDACHGRGDHAQRPHLHCCHLHLAFSSVCECGGAPERPPTSFTRLSAPSTPSTCSPLLSNELGSPWPPWPNEQRTVPQQASHPLPLSAALQQA